MRALQAALREEVWVMTQSLAVLLVLGLAAGTLACWRITRGWNRSRLL